MESMCFKQDGTISKLNGKLLKLVDHFTYLSGNIASTESYVNIGIGKAWNTIDKLSTIWKSDLFDNIKQEFFQAVAISVLM